MDARFVYVSTSQALPNCLLCCWYSFLREMEFYMTKKSKNQHYKGENSDTIHFPIGIFKSKTEYNPLDLESRGHLLLCKPYWLGSSRTNSR